MPWDMACGVTKGLLGSSTSHQVALPSKDREQACLFGTCADEFFLAHLREPNWLPWLGKILSRTLTTNHYYKGN